METIASVIAPVKAVQQPLSKDIETVLLKGDLASLNTDQRISYYHHICESLGLNPSTRPFEYIELPTPGGSRKLFLYAKKDATDQLRKLHNISIEIITREHIDELYVVTARAFTKDDRCDESIGAVALTGFNRTTNKSYSLSGDAKANALMKAETKAKRRATLSICGLGMLDESELESIPGAKLATLSGNKIENQILKTEVKNTIVNQELASQTQIDKQSSGHQLAENSITEKQRKRLFAISKESGWEEEDLKIYLFDKYGIGSTKEIDWLEYGSICDFIENNPKNVGNV